MSRKLFYFSILLLVTAYSNWSTFGDGKATKFLNYITGRKIHSVTKYEAPKYNPQISVSFYKIPYNNLKEYLLYARLTTPNRWIDSNGSLNEGERKTLFLIKDKVKLSKIIREFDKIIGTQPQTIRINDEHIRYIKQYQLEVEGKEGKTKIYQFFKYYSVYYYGSTVWPHKEPNCCLLRKMPTNLLKLLDLKQTTK